MGLGDQETALQLPDIKVCVLYIRIRRIHSDVEVTYNTYVMTQIKRTVL